MEKESKNLFIIAGCNGAGKTTASFALLPDLLNCREYVNADEIAKGLSPFQVEQVAIEAGRIMLQRIQTLLSQDCSFAIETTLSTKSYQNLIQEAKNKGYEITLLFFWLNKVSLAKERVRLRVSKGGHNIPEAVIERRYYRGIQNLFNIYLSIADKVLIFDNSFGKRKLIARKNLDGRVSVFNQKLFKAMELQSKEDQNFTAEDISDYEVSVAKAMESDSLLEKIMVGLDIAYQRLEEDARKNGTTLVIWQDGKVVHIHP